MSASKLDKVLERLKNKNLPPVHLWSPELTGDMDMRIAADGTWYYQGSQIQRARMIKLFSTILRREQDDYFLVTPVEKYRIQVEDAPFIAVEVDQIVNETTLLLFRTNVDDQIIASRDNPITVRINSDTSEPRPYLHIRDRLNALIHRNVFYQLVELARPQTINGSEQLVIYSEGEQFSLGQI